MHREFQANLNCTGRLYLKKSRKQESKMEEETRSGKFQHWDLWEKETINPNFHSVCLQRKRGDWQKEAIGSSQGLLPVPFLE